MKKILAHIIFLFVFTFASANEIPNKIIYSGVGTKTAAVRLINNSAYVTIPEIARILGYKVINTHEISRGNTVLKFAAGSFFVVMESPEHMKMAQMLQPAIIVEKRIYVPFTSFFTSLETLKLFEVEFEEKAIVISQIGNDKPAMKEEIPQHLRAKVDEDPKPVEEEKVKLANTKVTEQPQSEDDFFKAFVQTSKIMRKSLQYLNPDTTETREVSKKMESKIPPNRYVLPKKLKRSELEEK